MNMKLTPEEIEATGTCVQVPGLKVWSDEARAAALVARRRHGGADKPGSQSIPKPESGSKLPGVQIHSAPKKTSTKIPAHDVTFREGTGAGAGTAPKEKDKYGTYIFDSAPSGFASHEKEGATFSITDRYGAALQKAKQQAGAWGHNQLRIAP